VSPKHAFQVALGMEGAICLVQLVKRALPLSPLPNFACNQSHGTRAELSCYQCSCSYLCSGAALG
jgi:hypothetical protein